MCTTLADLKVAGATDRSVTLAVTGLRNPVELAVRKYERGAVIRVPWGLRDRLGFPHYDALKQALRAGFGHVETRTETDPAFVTVAKARTEATTTNRT